MRRKRGDLLVVGFDERPVHDAEFDGVLAGRAQINVDDGVQLGQRIGQLAVSVCQRVSVACADFVQHFEEQGLLALEMAIQDRFGDAGGARRSFRSSCSGSRASRTAAWPGPAVAACDRPCAFEAHSWAAQSCDVEG